VTIKGKQVIALVNEKIYMKYTLPAPVSGKVGIWTKADSIIYFEDYTVLAD